jgi:hypothetical protein
VRIITSLIVALTIALLLGCSGHGDKNLRINQIDFKCSALESRKASPYVTSIHSISDGDILFFARRDTCNSTMGSISNVDYANRTFLIRVDGVADALHLKVNNSGNIVAVDAKSTEELSKKFYVLGVLETTGLFDN